MSASTAHVIVGFMCLLSTAMLAAVLPDGRSMFLFDNNVDVAVDDISAVLGTRYGLGTFHDSNGRNWDDSANLVEVFGCDEHKHRFNLLKASTFISIVFSGFGVVISLLGASRFSRVYGMASMACNVLFLAMVVMAMGVAWALWSQSRSCDNNISIKIKDSFTISYGPIFLTVCFVFSLINIAVLAAMGALKDNTVRNEPAENKAAEEGEHA